MAVTAEQCVASGFAIRCLRSRREASFGVPDIACPRQRLIEFRLDHCLDEPVHTVANGGFDRIEPVLKKLGRRCRHRLPIREACDRAVSEEFALERVAATS